MHDGHTNPFLKKDSLRKQLIDDAEFNDTIRRANRETRASRGGAVPIEDAGGCKICYFGSVCPNVALSSQIPILRVGWSHLWFHTHPRVCRYLSPNRRSSIPKPHIVSPSLPAIVIQKGCDIDHHVTAGYSRAKRRSNCDVLLTGTSSSLLEVLSRWETNNKSNAVPVKSNLFARAWQRPLNSESSSAELLSTA